MEMSAHAFVGSKVTGDLKQLDTEKHSDPGQLKRRPYRENDCERILIKDFA